MPRIILEEQPSYEFTHEMEVRAGDINMGGHLDHAKLIGYFYEARARIFDALGISAGFMGGEAVGAIIGDLSVNYRAEVTWGEILRVESSIGEIREKSFRIFHRITSKSNVVALAETGIVAFSFQTRRATAIPTGFLQKLDNYRRGA